MPADLRAPPGHRPGGGTCWGVTLWMNPLPIEAAPLRALLRGGAATSARGRSCWRGSVDGRRLCATVCGAGADPCRAALDELLAELPVIRVLLVGVAGALSPALAVGDVVVASRPMAWPGPGTGMLVPVLGAVGGKAAVSKHHRRVPGGSFRVMRGRMVSWPEPTLDSACGRRLWQRYGAHCVDRETGAAARCCAEHQVPFLAVRGIADRAGRAPEEIAGANLALAAWHATAVALEALAGPQAPALVAVGW